MTTASAVPAARPASGRSARDPTVPALFALRVGGPAHEVEQADVKDAAVAASPVERSPSLIGVFDHAQIERRRLARPLSWYAEPRTFPEKNAVYVEEALDLTERLATAALEDAGVHAEDVDAIVFVSSTGISTPSLDAFLAQRLGIAASATRLPLWGLGCAGGVAGLARAGDLVRAGHKRVLLLAVELCSLTFVLSDASATNFIGTALFADGGAAAVLGPEPAGGDGLGKGDGPERRPLVRLRHARSHLVEDSAALTGWDVVDGGFKLRLSTEIPTMMISRLGPIVHEAITSAGLTTGDVDELMVHPGGAKVLDGYAAALGLDDDALATSRETLRLHGNMSSPTVLFALEKTLRRQPQGLGLLSATGPGFAAEHLVVEFG